MRYICVSKFYAEIANQTQIYENTKPTPTATTKPYKPEAT